MLNTTDRPQDATEAEPQTPEDKAKRQYGIGASISYDPRTDRYRVRYRDTGKSIWFDTRQDADNLLTAIAKAGDKAFGITVRELGELWLAEHDFSRAVVRTWRALVCRSHFIDWPASTLLDSDIIKWTHALVKQKKMRSVLKDGKRTLLERDDVIERSYAKSGLSALRSCLKWASNSDPKLVDKNVAAEVELPSARSKNGKVRTKKAKKKRSALDFMPQRDCVKVFFCEHCAAVSGLASDDLEQLVRCEHFPFFYRVAHSVSIMQGLREGEIASQRWERIRWVNSGDWTGHSWMVETSWDGETKNGQDREQALIPMAARLLHRWWQFKGCPDKGLLFCVADAKGKGSALGELALFVAAHPDHPNRELVRLAQERGLPLTLRRVETLRSEARKRAARKRASQDKMFSVNYDFAWFDTPYNDKHGVLRVRLGWRSKLGISVDTRFHDYRDTAATHLLSGTWGPKWSLHDVSQWLGHSDIKVTQERYAHLTLESRTQAAAGVDPTRLGEAAFERVSPENLCRKSAEDPRTSPLLSIRNHLAPEAGLEPTTNRLTEVRARPDSAKLDGNSAHFRHISPPPMAAALEAARKVLQAAASGAPLRAAALELAGVLLDAEEAAGEQPAAGQAPLRLVKS